MPDFLKIAASLMDCAPHTCSRTLLLHPRLTLDQLHKALQTAFGWDDYHLHCFSDARGTRYSLPSRFEEDSIDERRVFLPDAFPSRDTRLLYQYDFGDDWNIQLKLIGLADPLTYPYDPMSFVTEGRSAFGGKPRAAICIEATGAAPLEDCGSIPGFLTILEAARRPEDKRTKRQRELVAWATDSDPLWNPDRPHIDLICQNLARIRVKKANALPDDGPAHPQ